MKWTKVALISVIPALALLLLGGSMRPPAAKANATAIVSLTNVLCLTLTATDGDWNDDGEVRSNDSSEGFSRCNTLTGNVPVLARVLGADVDHPTPEDFLSVDKDFGQLHEIDGRMFFLVFVDDDDPMGFWVEEGLLEAPATEDSSISCGPGAGYDFNDEDCDDDGVRGDGIVTVKLVPGPHPNRGPAMLKVRQGMLEMEEKYTIVGEPHDIKITVLKDAIQDGAAECKLMKSPADFYKILGSSDRAVVVGTLLDDDGTQVASGLVHWETDDESKATMAGLITPSVDLTALGVGAPNTICGTIDSGTVTITAKITSGDEETGLGLDPGTNAGKKVVMEIPVQGVPTSMVLAADPPSLVCDGTASSNVSATLTNDADEPAIDGTEVRFETRALGIVDPITASAAAGIATTKVTPLSALYKGVTVMAAMALDQIDWEELLHNYEDLIDPDLLADLQLKDKDHPERLKYDVTWRKVYAEDLPMTEAKLEGSLLVGCTEAAPAAAQPGAPSAATGPAISPPATGDGGYSSSGQAMSWWLAPSLSLGFALLAGGLALRRRAL